MNNRQFKGSNQLLCKKLKTQLLLLISLSFALLSSGQPGSYTFSFSFDLYQSDSLINSQQNDFDFIWFNEKQEILEYTADSMNCRVAYKKSKTFNHCIGTYYNSSKYSLLIITANLDSMLLHFNFNSTPMDSHFILDKICFETGVYTLKPFTFKSYSKISEEKYYLNIMKVSEKLCK